MNTLPTKLGDRVRYTGPKAGENPDGLLGSVVLIGTLSDDTPYVALKLDDREDAVLVTDAGDLEAA